MTQTRLRLVAAQTLTTNLGLMALGLVTSVILSRHLGPAGRGELTAAMLWPPLLVYGSSMGIMPATLYYAALCESRPEVVFTNAALIALLQSAIVIPTGFVVMPILLGSQSETVVSTARLYLVVIPISLLAQYGIAVIQGLMRMSVFNYLRSILPVGYLAGTVGLVVYRQLSIQNVVILHLWLNLLTMLATCAALHKIGVRIQRRADVELGKQMVTYGLQAQLGNLSSLGNLRLDQTLMAAWLSPKQLGLYVTAVSFSAVGQVLSGAVRTVLTPSIAHRKLPEQRARLALRAFRAYWLLSIPAFGALAVALPFILPLIYGHAFREATGPAEVLLLAALFLGAKDVLSGVVQALGRPIIVSHAEAIGLVATLGLLILTLRTLGIMGAAIASLVAYGATLAIVALGLQSCCGIRASDLFSTNLKSSWATVAQALGRR